MYQKCSAIALIGSDLAGFEIVPFGLIKNGQSDAKKRRHVTLNITLADFLKGKYVVKRR